MSKKRLLYIFIFAIITYIAYLFIPSKKMDAFHIAIVGPFSGENAASGLFMSKAVKLHIEEINKKGGIRGRNIVLQEYDDKNDPILAKQMAEKIIQDNLAIAVIGHKYSSCSIAGGEVYKKSKIPAIAPGSTHINVTKGNEWYFRTIFNDNLQGRFLANYSKRVFNPKHVTIIQEDKEYGAYLAKVFGKVSQELDMEVAHSLSFVQHDPNLDTRIQEIVDELKTQKDIGIIFLATHGKEGLKLIKALRTAGILNPIINPDSFATEVASQDPEKMSSVFVSTADIYTTTPLIYDTANDKATEFRENFRGKYGDDPDWLAAFAYDSAYILTTAIEKSGISGDKENLTNERKIIRDYLASINKLENAIEGATGYSYFNEHGDATKPVSIGIYKGKGLISALTQLQLIRNINEIPDVETALKEGRILYMDGRYMYRTNVVYTGVKLNKITDIDEKKQTFAVDFSLWFRYLGDIKPENIEFTNSVEPIEIGEPVDVEIRDQIVYKLYKLKGVFKLDSLPGRSQYEQHVLGLTFRHKKLNRNNLIYVSDFLGMGITKNRSFVKKIENDQVLSSVPNWVVDRAWFSQTVSSEDSMGVPRYLNLAEGKVEYSRFNLAVRVQTNEFRLKHLIPDIAAPYILFITVVGLILIPFANKKYPFLKHYTSFTWFLPVILILTILLSLEVVLEDLLVEKTNSYNITMFINFFGILWWWVPAIIINRGFEKFLWIPLENNTSRKIPTVVRRMAALFIYTLAFFGIVAYVYDQKLTSLLATSGVIAMIIGLAIQINISNIFSGIAINLERPFGVGDWIKLGENEEGKVIDITWRTTRVKTRDENVICIPNSKAAEAVIKNFSMPDNNYEMWFFVHVDPVHPPDRVQKILMDAVLSTNVISKEVKPYTRFKGFTEWSAKYGVYYVLNDYGKKFPYEEVVWKRVWAHLNRAGISPAIQRQEVHMFRGMKARGQEAATKPIVLLEEIDIFHPFSSESKKFLSKKMNRIHYRDGQRIVKQGEPGNSFFIIVEGVVKVIVDLEDGSSIEVARLGAGNFFGEMSLLTGENRTASIVSGTDTYVYEITKEDIAPLIEKQPEVLQPLSEVLMRRKMATESEKDLHYTSKSDKEKQVSESLQQKIQRFFGFGKK